MKRVAAAALLLAVAALVVVGPMVAWQERMIYFPQQARLADWTPPGLAPWPSADDARGLAASPEGPPRATAVVFHGNAGHAGQRAMYAQQLTRLGVRTILAEYPGYGPRPGTPGEATLVADAVRTLELAAGEFGAPLIVIGESLGSGVAAAATARAPEQVAGLMLFTPWDKLEHVAAHHYPWLPVRWLLREHYDIAADLARLGKPVWIAVAAHDEVVPAELGVALHAGLSGPRRLIVIEGASHNDWWNRFGEGGWQAALDFVLGATH